MNQRLHNAALAIAGMIDTAVPPIRRRHAAGTRRPAPTSGALAPPVPIKFEATTTTPDGDAATVIATAAPGNEISGPRRPTAREREKEAEPAGSLSIAEGSGHPAGQRGRPTTWIVVAFIALAFLTAGLGLVFDLSWLFVAGLIAVAAGLIAGWAFHIMADLGGSGTDTN
jgi:hypothetical protein